MARNISVRYPTELRERAVRMVLEGVREGVYSSEWAAICAVAQMLGPIPETVRLWVGKAEVRRVGGGLLVMAEALGGEAVRRSPVEKGLPAGGTDPRLLWGVAVGALIRECGRPGINGDRLPGG